MCFKEKTEISLYFCSPIPLENVKGLHHTKIDWCRLFSLALRASYQIFHLLVVFSSSLKFKQESDKHKKSHNFIHNFVYFLWKMEWLITIIHYFFRSLFNFLMYSLFCFLQNIIFCVCLEIVCRLFLWLVTNFEKIINFYFNNFLYVHFTIYI